MNLFSSTPSCSWILSWDTPLSGLSTASNDGSLFNGTVAGRDSHPWKTFSAINVASCLINSRSPRVCKRSNVPILSQDSANRETIAPGSIRSRNTFDLGRKVRDRALVVGTPSAARAKPPHVNDKMGG